MDLQMIADGRNAYPLNTLQYYPDLVRSIQVALRELGYDPGPLDGRWERDTDRAYQSFARRYRFRQDELSPGAAKQLLDAIAPGTVPSPSSQPVPWPSSPPSTASSVAGLDLQAIARGQTSYPISAIQSNTNLVRVLQTALNRMGFTAGAVDGRWGSQTSAAYRAFALRYGFNPNELSPRAANFIIRSAGIITPTPVPTPLPTPQPTPIPTPPPSPTGNYFEEALQFTLRWEGGYVNHPNDYGGATNKGIIQRVYDDYRRRQGLPLRSVRFITDAEVRDIYENDYWKPSQSNLMVRPLAIAHFDTAVNFGVRGSVLFLQESLGVTADGIFGPNTRAALQRANTQSTALRYVDRRIEYRYIRVSQDPSQRVFLQGWLNRDNDLKRYISRLG
jgi:lysozyme family protein